MWSPTHQVDPVKLGLPDYFDVIKQPMDLGTIKRRLEQGTYYGELDQVRPPRPSLAHNHSPCPSAPRRSRVLGARQEPRLPTYVVIQPNRTRV